MNELINALIYDLAKFGAESLEYKFLFEKNGKNYNLQIFLRENDEEDSDGEDSERNES